MPKTRIGLFSISRYGSNHSSTKHERGEVRPRYNTDSIGVDLTDRMVFADGPRQAGVAAVRWTKGHPWLPVVALYLMSRLALASWGLRFHIDDEFWFVHSIDALRAEFWSSLFYTHQSTPMMNIMRAASLVFPEDWQAPVMWSVYIGFGCLFVYSMWFLVIELTERSAWATTIAVFASLCPPFIYFETLFIYTFPTAALLAFSGVLLLQGLRHQDRTGYWWGFFLTLTVICCTRTTFHLAWYLAVVGGVYVLSIRKPPATPAVVGFGLVLTLYLKNLFVFGFFGTSSWFGFNATSVTTLQLSHHERMQWVQQGVLGAASSRPFYAPASAYFGIVDPGPATGVAVLDEDKRQNGRPNFNHRVFPKVAKLRFEDALTYIGLRPGDYLRTVGGSFVEFFQPSTRWHPKDPERSPHRHNRSFLEPWENFFNALWHGWAWGMGIYPFAFLIVIIGTLRMLKGTFFSKSRQASDLLGLYFSCTFLYCVCVSCLVTTGELERNRVVVEFLLWFVVVGLVKGLGLPRRPPHARWRFPSPRIPH